jgi:hypothetical protein
MESRGAFAELECSLVKPSGGLGALAWVFIGEVAESEGGDSSNFVSILIETLETVLHVHRAELCEDVDGIRIRMFEKSKLGTKRVRDSWERAFNSQRRYGPLENGVAFHAGHWTFVERAANGHELRINDFFRAQKGPGDRNSKRSSGGASQEVVQSFRLKGKSDK